MSVLLVRDFAALQSETKQMCLYLSPLEWGWFSSFRSIRASRQATLLCRRWKMMEARFLSRRVSAPLSAAAGDGNVHRSPLSKGSFFVPPVKQFFFVAAGGKIVLRFYHCIYKRAYACGRRFCGAGKSRKEGGGVAHARRFGSGAFTKMGQNARNGDMLLSVLLSNGAKCCKT